MPSTPPYSTPVSRIPSRQSLREVSRILSPNRSAIPSSSAAPSSLSIQRFGEARVSASPSLPRFQLRSTNAPTVRQPQPGFLSLGPDRVPAPYSDPSVFPVGVFPHVQFNSPGSLLRTTTLKSRSTVKIRGPDTLSSSSRVNLISPMNQQSTLGSSSRLIGSASCSSVLNGASQTKRKRDNVVEDLDELESSTSGSVQLDSDCSSSVDKKRQKVDISHVLRKKRAAEDEGTSSDYSRVNVSEFCNKALELLSKSTDGITASLRQEAKSLISEVTQCLNRASADEETPGNTSTGTSTPISGGSERTTLNGVKRARGSPSGSLSGQDRLRALSKEDIVKLQQVVQLLAKAFNDVSRNTAATMTPQPKPRGYGMNSIEASYSSQKRYLERMARIREERSRSRLDSSTSSSATNSANHSRNDSFSAPTSASAAAVDTATTTTTSGSAVTTATSLLTTTTVTSPINGIGVSNTATDSVNNNNNTKITTSDSSPLNSPSLRTLDPKLIARPEHFEKDYIQRQIKACLTINEIQDTDPEQDPILKKLQEELDAKNKQLEALYRGDSIPVSSVSSALSGTASFSMPAVSTTAPREGFVDITISAVKVTSTGTSLTSTSLSFKTSASGTLSFGSSSSVSKATFSSGNTVIVKSADSTVPTSSSAATSRADDFFYNSIFKSSTDTSTSSSDWVKNWHLCKLPVLANGSPSKQGGWHPDRSVYATDGKSSPPSKPSPSFLSKLGYGDTTANSASPSLMSCVSSNAPQINRSLFTNSTVTSISPPVSPVLGFGGITSSTNTSITTSTNSASFTPVFGSTAISKSSENSTIVLGTKISTTTNTTSAAIFEGLSTAVSGNSTNNFVSKFGSSSGVTAGGFGTVTASTAPTFGVSSTNSGGAVLSSDSVIFGKPLPATTTPVFGSINTSTATPIFGSTNTTTATSSTFGASNTPTATPIFGSVNTTSANSTFMFGKSSVSTASNTGHVLGGFGTSSSLLGGSQTSSSSAGFTGGFGASSTTSTATTKPNFPSIFNSSNSNSTTTTASAFSSNFGNTGSSFPSSQPNQTAPFVFGGGAAAASTSSTFAFGGTRNGLTSQASGGFNTGGSGTGGFGDFSGFGNAATTTASVTSPFSASNGTSVPIFGVPSTASAAAPAAGAAAGVFQFGGSGVQSNQPSAPGLFKFGGDNVAAGVTTTSGASAQPFVFGAQGSSATNGGFGSKSTAPFSFQGQGQGGLSNGLSNGGGFGGQSNPGQSAFGTPSGTFPVFGGNPGGFGGFGNSATGTLGASTGPVFGTATAVPQFGAAQPPAFGGASAPAPAFLGSAAPAQPFGGGLGFGGAAPGLGVAPGLGAGGATPAATSPLFNIGTGGTNQRPIKTATRRVRR